MMFESSCAQVHYRLDPAKAVELYSTVGMDFEAKIIQPQVRAAVRKATSSRDAKALYTSEREQARDQCRSTV